MASNNDQSLHALTQQLKDELRGVWRFRWQAMITAWVVLLLGCIAVSALPDKYLASSKFFVDASSRLGPLVQGLTVETNVETQLAFVRQMLLSRQHLSELAESPALVRYAMSAKKRSDLVDTLRDKVQIIPVRGGEMAKGLLLEFDFEYPNRQVALFVVKSLVDSFVEETQGANVRKANEAEAFLTAQLKDVEVKLTETEAQLAEFKREHFGTLPGQGGDYFSRLQTEREALDSARNQLGVLTSQRETLASQLRGQAPFVPSGRVSPSDLRAPGRKDIDTRIMEAESKLEDLLLRFTDKYPEVVALRTTIDELKSRRQQEFAELRAGGAGSGSLATSENPVYQNIQQQISHLEVEIAAVRAGVGQRERRIGELQRSISTEPEVEAKLTSLNRDYGVTKAQYESLLASLQKARISENAEETGVIRFEVIEPPAVKSMPVGPKRVLLLLAVLLTALGGGVAIAFGMHQMRPVFASVIAVTEQLKLPLLGIVSRGSSAAELAAVRADAHRYVAAAAALIAFFLLTLLFRGWTSGLSRLVSG